MIFWSAENLVAIFGKFPHFGVFRRYKMGTLIKNGLMANRIKFP